MSPTTGIVASLAAAAMPHSAAAQRAALDDTALAPLVLRGGGLHDGELDALLDRLGEHPQRGADNDFASALLGAIARGDQLERYLQLGTLDGPMVAAAIARAHLGTTFLQRLVDAASGAEVPRCWAEVRADIADALCSTQAVTAHQATLAARAWAPRRRAEALADVVADLETYAAIGPQRLRGEHGELVADRSAQFPSHTPDDHELAVELADTCDRAEDGDVSAVLHAARHICALRPGVADRISSHDTLMLATGFCGAAGGHLEALVDRCAQLLHNASGATPALAGTRNAGRSGCADDPAHARLAAELGHQAELTLCQLLERPEATRQQRARIWELLASHDLFGVAHVAHHLRVHPHAPHDGITAAGCGAADAAWILDSTWKAVPSHTQSATRALWVQLADVVDAAGCLMLLEVLDDAGGSRLGAVAWARLVARHGELVTDSPARNQKHQPLCGPLRTRVVASADRTERAGAATTTVPTVAGAAAECGGSDGDGPGSGGHSSDRHSDVGAQRLGLAISTGTDAANAAGTVLAERIDRLDGGWELAYSLADELSHLSIDDFTDTIASLAGRADAAPTRGCGTPETATATGAR